MNYNLTSFYTTTEVCAHFRCSHRQLREWMKQPDCKLKPIRVNQKLTLFSGYTIAETDGHLCEMVQPNNAGYFCKTIPHFNHQNYYTVQETAKILRTRTTAVYKLIERGLLKARKTGKRVRSFMIYGWDIAQYADVHKYQAFGVLYDDDN